MENCRALREDLRAYAVSFTVEEDTKIPNAATLTINKEDHTLAGMLRAQLLLSPHVLFCGYQVPHPLEPRFILKVQTDGSPQHSPLLAIDDACKGLILTLSKIKTSFVQECATFQANRPDDLAPGAAYGETGAYGGAFLGADPLGGNAAEPVMQFE